MAVYISEIDSLGGPGAEFIEIAAPPGTDVSGYSIVIYNTDGTVRSGPYSLGTLENTVNGNDVYVVENVPEGLPGIQQEHGIALVDDQGNTVQFLSFGGLTITAGDGPASGQQSQDIGTQAETGSLQSRDGGVTYQPAATPDPGFVPCYGSGTLVETPVGTVPVDALQPGDLVLTRDHGAQPVRWVHSAEQNLVGLPLHLRPVLISKNALGPGRPDRDLVVSPQHRILAGAGQLAEMISEEVFLPAKSLCVLKGVRHMEGRSQIRWTHFACDRHEVVRANGCFSETILAGRMVRAALEPGDRPEQICGKGPPARPCLSVAQAREALFAATGIAIKSRYRSQPSVTPGQSTPEGSLLWFEHV